MVSRRHVITGAAAGLLLPAGVLAQASGLQFASVSSTTRAKGPVFTLGVASGQPRPTSVILWSRLAPAPLLGGGMENAPVEARVRVATDAAMRNVIQDRMVRTGPEKGHALHYKAEGLQPGREYWYQFSFAGEDSPIGRTRTSDPASNAAKIAMAYCQHYEAGFFAAFRDLAEWAPDCVIHVGDYIYEGAGGSGPLGPRMVEVGGGERRMAETVRRHEGPETVTLWDYRNRYAQYRTDPDLQAAHAAAPWIVAMDDHEIDNNWADDIPQDPDRQTPLEFQVRRIAALQAYWENMPIEQPPVLAGLRSTLQMYGAYRFGPAAVHLLDTRQFRSDQTCGDGRKVMCPETADPKRTMLGQAQEQWLAAELGRSNAPFNLIATQIWYTPYRYNEAPAAPVVNLDSWDGYPAARERLNAVLARGVANPVFLTGDWHTAMASAVYAEPFNPRSRRLGVEMVGSSISSFCPWARDMEVVREANPQVKYLNGNKRGYLRVDVTRETCTGTFRVVTDAGLRASAVTTDTEIRTRDL
jgi:alkaline phosphatase D